VEAARATLTAEDATGSASPPESRKGEPRCRSRTTSATLSSPGSLTHQRLAFIQNFADQDGNTITPASIGLPPDTPQDVCNLVTFHALGEHRTELTVTEYGYVSDQILELSKAGLEQVLDKLATSLQQPGNA
jgi:hypothetical protein